MKSKKTKGKKSKTISIGVVGYGFVGQAVAHGFSQGGGKTKYEVLFYDKYKESVPLQEVVKKSEFIFVCLPTPMKADESGIDLAIMNDAIKKIAAIAKNTDKIIIIKSTIVPGTTAGYAKKYPNCNFCFNPEFLTEANFLQDFLNADRTVIGADDQAVLRRVTDLYQQRFPEAKIFQTSLTAAELVKYAANAFLATKVIFANEIFDFCEKLKINYEEIKEMVGADKRIGVAHLTVTKERGFGKKCFPKDLVALMGLARRLKIDSSLMQTVWSKNKKIRKNHEWHEIPFSVSGNHRFKK